MKLAAIHLEGKALLWHQAYMKRRNHVTPSWEEYVKDLTVRFSQPYDDPMADLKATKQKGKSVQDYHDSFDMIASRLNLTEENLLSCYLGGLDDELAIRMFAPKTIQQALCLAKLQEAAEKAKKPKTPQKTPPLLPTPNLSKQPSLPHTTNWRSQPTPPMTPQKIFPTPQKLTPKKPTPQTNKPK